MLDFTMGRRTLRGRAAVACSFAALAAVAAGCGSSNDSSSSSSSSSGSSSSASTPSGGGAGLAAAKTALAEYQKPPTDIGVTEPVGKPIPTGKKLVYIYCGAPICNVLADGAKK